MKESGVATKVVDQVVPSMDEQLKTLFDYTKFHIGMYTTLVAAIVGVFANDSWAHDYAKMTPFIMGTVVCFLIAGAAGGLIASAIPFYSSFNDFENAKLGPWRMQWIPAIICTHVEHTAFWAGCAIAAAGLFASLPR
jgi:hypothetical protein